MEVCATTRTAINKREIPTSLAALVGLVAMAVLGAMASAQATRVLSIEQITVAPFPYNLIASPRDATVAWVYDERGARNVWIAGPAAGGGYSSKRLTPYTADDGTDIVDLAWNGDGKTLFYTRGGDGGGRTPVNPMSLPEGPKGGEIWAVSIDGNAPRLIGQGQSASPSPNGDRVVFLRSGQPWVAPANSPGEPAILFRDRGQVNSFAWSPDGTRVAFVTVRPQHSIVGVYDFAKKSIHWISPGIDKDTDPVWSPDGRRIAFLRLPSDEGARFVSNREGYPWEIWIADESTGEGKRIWRAKPGVGSRFRELFNSKSSVFWTAGDRLVFPWEVTGWVRLYSISVSGGEPTLVTPGQSEIFGAELNNERTEFVYSSNQDDIDHRHIWVLPAGDGAPHQVTTGKGVEDYPVITNDNRILALRGEARSPMRPVLVDAKGMVDLAPQAIPADFPAADLVEPQLVTFKAPDGLTVHAQLFIPKGRTNKGPALIFFHGGPTNRQMFASWDPFETHTHLYEANQYLANHGYVVLSVNYRGGSGYGFEYRAPPGFGAEGASELNDIIGAANYLLSRPDVDPKRLGVWGGSYGGRMASLAMASAPQFFAVGVDYAGVHNWLKMPGFTPANDSAAKLAYESSAIAHVDNWKAPVLLMHGDADPTVPFEQTTELAAELRKRGIPVDYVMIPDEVHFLLKHSSWNRVFDKTREYLDQHLK